MKLKIKLPKKKKKNLEFLRFQLPSGMNSSLCTIMIAGATAASSDGERHG
jgi:hypothetical protein